GLFDDCGKIGFEFAEAFVNAWGMDITVFEAPTKKSQFELLDHFGPRVNLSNVRLEEVLRVEIYRRGLHSDAYRVPALRPPRGGGNRGGEVSPPPAAPGRGPPSAQPRGGPPRPFPGPPPPPPPPGKTPAASSPCRRWTRRLNWPGSCRTLFWPGSRRATSRR